MSARQASSLAREVAAEPALDVPLTDTHESSNDPNTPSSTAYQPYCLTTGQEVAVYAMSPRPSRGSSPAEKCVHSVHQPTAYVGNSERALTDEEGRDRTRAARGSGASMPWGGDRTRAARGSGASVPQGGGGVRAARGSDASSPSDPLVAIAVHGMGQRGQSPNARQFLHYGRLLHHTKA